MATSERRKSIKVSRAFPWQVVKVMEKMRDLGIYGRTVNEVMERIVCAWLVEHSIDINLRLPKVSGR